MNHVERFRAVMNFQPVDRLPRWEWAMWWGLTIDRWHGEGLPAEMNAVAIMDTDGDCTKLIPWVQSVGVEGVLPLERQAKVDGMVLRQAYPTLRMAGHYNKLVMHLGEAAMRAEFERLAPLMKTGGFIPSVDHLTPPAVSIEDYLLYLRLLDEYTAI